MKIVPADYHEENGVGIEILTPWACAAVQVQGDYQQGRSSFSVEQLKTDYSGDLHAWVVTADPLPAVTVSINQAGQTFTPAQTLDPFPKAQQFVFRGLDKALPIAVTAQVGGQTYSYTWNLADLK